MGYFISGGDAIKKYGLLPMQMYHIIYSGKITVYDYSGNLLDADGLQSLGNKIYHAVRVNSFDTLGIVGPYERAYAMATMGDSAKQTMEQLDIEKTRQLFYRGVCFVSEELETYIKKQLPDLYKHYQQEQKKIMDNKQKSVSQQAHIEKTKNAPNVIIYGNGESTINLGNIGNSVHNTPSNGQLTASSADPKNIISNPPLSPITRAAWEAAIEEYEKKHNGRKNGAPAKRVRTYLKFLQGESFSALAADNSNLSRDLEQAKEEDIPKLKELFPELPELPIVPTRRTK